MPPSNPSLVKIVLDGGVLMGPFLLVIVVWIGCTARFMLNKQRTPKGLVGLLMFPLAFGLLAVSHRALHWHAEYKVMELSGFPDPMQQIQHGLVVARSGLAIAAAGGLSFVVTALMFLLPCRAKSRGDGHAGHTATASPAESELVPPPPPS